ncbi:MAG: hypothetical protein AB2785_02585 [Candidatus Thiodiazotropha endolucinida]
MTFRLTTCLARLFSFFLLFLLISCGGGSSTTTYTVSASASSDGSITPASTEVALGSTANFTVTPDSGFEIDTVTGCGGTLAANVYTTGAVTTACTVVASFVVIAPPVAPVGFTLTPMSIKTFNFSWVDGSDETEYRLLEDPDGQSGFTEVATIAAESTEHDLAVFLPGRVNARYILQTCNSAGCTDSATANVTGSLVEAVGYIKASNTGTFDLFGSSVSLAADGNTLAVGAHGEGSNATGIDGTPADNSAGESGAVYVFARSGGAWVQQAYLKASNTGEDDNFGISVSLSGDGNTLAVGARREGSEATGIDGNQTDDSASESGAVYVFTRSDSTWAQQAYLKASNTEESDWFGHSVSLSADGNTLAVGARHEDSNAIGVDGDQANNLAVSSGAVYVFTSSDGTWAQQAYLKASNTGAADTFGTSVSLAADGNTLAVCAHGEASNATGINGNQADNSAIFSGAVYVFTSSGGTWAQQAYLKASDSRNSDRFGSSVSLAADGNTLAVGAPEEDSNATGIDGNQADISAISSGAVYVFTRSDGTWAQQAYLKASNTGAADTFGTSVSLAADGNTLAVGASGEDSNATGINGNQTDNSDRASGAVYVFARSNGTWAQQAYLKASNTGEIDNFGSSVSLVADGNTLAVGASGEDSNATGINGNQADNSVIFSGAVYLY